MPPIASVIRGPHIVNNKNTIDDNNSSPMTDRLAELQSVRASSSSNATKNPFITTTGVNDTQDREPKDLEENSYSDEELAVDMPTFYRQRREIEDKLEKIKQLSGDIAKRHAEALASTDVAKSEQLSRDIAALTARADQYVDDIRLTLKAIEERNKSLEASPDASSLKSMIRLRKDNLAMLANRFVKTAKSYDRMQRDSRAKYRSLMVRQYKIVHPKATEAEMEALMHSIETGTAHQRVFAMAVREDAKMELERMRARADDMKVIEGSIQALARMFSQMAQLIEAQGSLVNRIEHSVATAEDYTAKSKQSMEKAVVSQKSIQKKKWIMATVIFVVVLLFALLIFMILKSLNPLS